MRRAIKIKAYAILLAWMVIFTHGVIPHHHIEENEKGCSELIHDHSSGHSEGNGILEYENQPVNENACHFSGFLFNKFSQDNLIISAHKISFFSPRLSDGHKNLYTDEFCLAEPYFGASSLRAPPVII